MTEEVIRNLTPTPPLVGEGLSGSQAEPGNEKGEPLAVESGNEKNHPTAWGCKPQANSESPLQRTEELAAGINSPLERTLAISREIDFPVVVAGNEKKEPLAVESGNEKNHPTAWGCKPQANSESPLQRTEELAAGIN
ncbi:MAG: hypothetical protein VKL59_10180, partial [Nostocaceae cyanobacterium]|nr:hypothetical protein [Nostocaceae cyanobacterium]